MFKRKRRNYLIPGKGKTLRQGEIVDCGGPQRVETAQDRQPEPNTGDPGRRPGHNTGEF